jgi:hypothetical protein
MTNDIEVADKLLNATDYKTLNILGFFRNAATSPPDYKNFIPLSAVSACSASQPSNLLVESI